jgi:hypothetical protein
MAGRVGAFSTMGPLLYVPFLLGAVLALAGATRAARVVLGTTALIAAALPVVSALAPVNRRPWACCRRWAGARWSPWPACGARAPRPEQRP